MDNVYIGSMVQEMFFTRKELITETFSILFYNYNIPFAKGFFYSKSFEMRVEKIRLTFNYNYA